MKIYTVDTYNEAATVKRPLQVILQWPLRRLDYFVKYLSKDQPDSIEKVLIQLQNNLEAATFQEYSANAFPEIFKACEGLENYPQLRNLAIRGILAFLNYRKYEGNPVTQESEYRTLDYLRSYLFLFYQFLDSLEAFLPRKAAINYYMKLVEATVEHFWNSSKRTETLLELLESDRASAAALQTHTRTDFLIDEGNVGTKITRCMWHRAMAELNDPDRAYTISCHVDFRMAQLSNENFVLTRTQTLMQAAPYCDFCWHDKRFDKTGEHPSAEFWEKLEDNPGRKPPE